MFTYRVLYQGDVIAESECPFCDISMGVLFGPCTVTSAYEAVRTIFQRWLPPDNNETKQQEEARFAEFYKQLEELQLEALRSDGHRILPEGGILIEDWSAHINESNPYHLTLAGCDPDTVHGWLDDHPDAKREWNEGTNGES